MKGNVMLLKSFQFNLEYLFKKLVEYAKCYIIKF